MVITWSNFFSSRKHFFCFFEEKPKFQIYAPSTIGGVLFFMCIYLYINIITLYLYKRKKQSAREFNSVFTYYHTTCKICNANS